MIKALLFDYDGVIVLSERPRFKVLQAQAAFEGVTLDDSTFSTMVGRTTKTFLDLVEPAMKDATKQKILEDYKREYKDKIVQHVEPVEAVVDFLMNYRGNVPFALVSMSDSKIIKEVTRHFEVYDKFQIIVSKEDMQHHKPHPEPYLTAAEKLGVDPAQCAVIEDTTVGVEAALNANMQAYVLMNGVNAKSEFVNQNVGFLKTRKDIQDILS